MGVDNLSGALLSSTTSQTIAPRSRDEALRQTRQFLRQVIRSRAAGEALPSVRQLQEQSGVGWHRLGRVLNEMEQQGLIERRARSGISQAESDPVTPAAGMIDLIVCDVAGDAHHGSSFSAGVVATLAEYAGNHQLGLRFRQFPQRTPLAEYQKLAAETSLDAAILLGPHAPDLAGMFEDQGVATVSIYAYAIQRQGTTIHWDDDRIVQLQLEHLWALGHQRIGYIDVQGPHHQEHMLPFLVRREAYYRRMAEARLPVAPHWVQPADGDPDRITAALAGMFDTEPTPTAVVVTDKQLNAAYHFFESRGMVVGRDVSVMGTDDLPEARQMRPPATTVRNAREVIAARAFELLSQRLAGEEAPLLLKVEPELCIRQSCVPPPGAGALDRPPASHNQSPAERSSGPGFTTFREENRS